MSDVQYWALVVDDDPSVRRTLHTTLYSLGFDIGEASNAAIVVPLTIVFEAPFTTLVSGNLTSPGFGHDPVWMCAGWAVAGAPFSAMTTETPPVTSLRTAVPLSPEPFCAVSFTVMLLAAIIDDELLSAATAGTVAAIAATESAATAQRRKEFMN